MAQYVKTTKDEIQTQTDSLGGVSVDEINLRETDLSLSSLRININNPGEDASYFSPSDDYSISARDNILTFENGESSLGHFNFDGRVNIVETNSTSNTTPGLSILTNNGTTTLSPGELYASKDFGKEGGSLFTNITDHIVSDPSSGTSAVQAGISMRSRAGVGADEDLPPHNSVTISHGSSRNGDLEVVGTSYSNSYHTRLVLTSKEGPEGNRKKFAISVDYDGNLTTEEV